MAGKWWEAAPVVGGEQQPQGGVILSDPYQERGDQRAEEDQGMQRELQVDVGNTGFNQRDKLRSTTPCQRSKSTAWQSRHWQPR